MARRSWALGCGGEERAKTAADDHHHQEDQSGQASGRRGRTARSAGSLPRSGQLGGRAQVGEGLADQRVVGARGGSEVMPAGSWD